LELLRNDNQNKQNSIDTKNDTIKKFDNEIEDQKNVVLEKSWKLQQSIGESFSNALVGYRNSKKKFFEKCISTYMDWDKKAVVKLDELKSKYDMAYSDDSAIHSTFPTINISESLKFEQSDLLQKVITGSKDSPVGLVIDVLKNSDWVRQGIDYIDTDANQCPFCQQEMTEELQQEIRNYFDETYELDCQSLNSFINKYVEHYNEILGDLKNILETDISFIDVSRLEPEYQLFNSLFKLNAEELERKKDSPSSKISLESFEYRLEKIATIIDSFNESIITNNEIVKNKNREQKNCSELLWFYIVSELEEDLKAYSVFFNGKKKAIDSVSNKIVTLNIEITENKKQMEDIEELLTSVAPTVTEINKILERFDFKGFYLEENKQQKGTYLILREDGTNAKGTLSEGEYNFITFLYFYYLIYGSQEKTGITSDKIIVIDDPISSLDSNVLFIVSTLVKNLLKDCRNNINGIIQTFILTHNVYFHKEVTFLGSGKEFSSKEVLFGIVRKKDNVTTFLEYDKNPIESTYQLLWRELAEGKTSTMTAFNTMRRILEYYFKIIGDMDYEKCIDEFDGNDKIVCKALVSCINDGSHFISDDFVITFDEENIDNYKRIFKLIFERLGHKTHYEMMMKTKI